MYPKHMRLIGARADRLGTFRICRDPTRVKEESERHGEEHHQNLYFAREACELLAEHSDSCFTHVRPHW